MLEDKTANQIIDRYHRIVMGDQNQIKAGGGDDGMKFVGTLKLSNKGATLSGQSVTTLNIGYISVSYWDTEGHLSSDPIEFTTKALTSFSSPSGTSTCLVGVYFYDSTNAQMNIYNAGSMGSFAANQFTAEFALFK